MNIQTFINQQPGMVVNHILGTITKLYSPTNGTNQEGEAWTMQKMIIADDSGSIECALFNYPGTIRVNDPILLVSEMTDNHGLQGVRRDEYKGKAQLKVTGKAQIVIGDMVAHQIPHLTGGNVQMPQTPQNPPQSTQATGQPQGHQQPPQSPPQSNAGATGAGVAGGNTGTGGQRFMNVSVATAGFVSAYRAHVDSVSSLAVKVIDRLMDVGASVDANSVFATIMIDMQRRDMLLPAQSSVQEQPNQNQQAPTNAGDDQQGNPPSIDDDDVPF